MKKILSIFLLFFCLININAQQLYYSNILRGGVTANGGAYSGISTMDVKIPSGSTIKSAYLLAIVNKQFVNSVLDSIKVYLNGKAYEFNNSNIVTPDFLGMNISTIYDIHSHINAINITDDIDSSINVYTLNVPTNLFGRWGGFYLYIVYQNPAYPIVSCNLYLNTRNVAQSIHYHLSNSSINTIYPVELGLSTDNICDVSSDGEYVFVHSDSIGLIGGSDMNANGLNCTVYANLSYYNDTLHALDDDNSDSLMSGSDCLADIKSYVSNNDTSVNLKFAYQTPNLGSSSGNAFTNNIVSVSLTYRTPCDTFSTSVSADTAICAGDSAQLWATGGTSTGSVPAYLWQPSYGLSCDTCANPVASPDSSVTYTVRIYHNDSCSKVLPVRVLVHKIKFNYYIDSATCGDSNGAVFITTPNMAQYTLGNQSNVTGIFTHLPGGSYNVLLTDSFGCQWQGTASVSIQNNAVASFGIFPAYTGQQPFHIGTYNNSSGANTHTWAVNGDTLQGNTIAYTFDSAGDYTVTLIACHNSYPCCDTAQKEVIVTQKNIITIPNVFTPNGDGINDRFTVKLKNIAQGKWAIYDRWGTQLVHTYLQQANENDSLTLQWNGKTTQGKSCSAGTYYYVVTYVTLEGKTKTAKGHVTLLR